MPSVYQTAQVSCSGGLDLRSNTQELLRAPGAATRLQNFEQSIAGGYRRINGYSALDNAGTPLPVPGTGRILGTAVYNNGFVVCRGDAVYFTFDRTEWIQVNRDINSPSNFATFSAGAAMPRTDAGNYTFDEYSHGAGVTDLIIRDPNNQMAVLTITGNSRDTAMFSYSLITSGGIAKASYGVILKEQHVASGNSDAPSEFYVSNIADIDNFEDGQSQQISVAEPITGLRVFRENLYVFCETSIWRASNLDNTAQTVIQNVTRNVGCVDGNTIQEIGGDLIFLSHDGFRTLAGTDRIDDVNISTISLDISTEVLGLLQNRNDFIFRSVVLKERSQYRLFYSVEGQETRNQRGIIATYYPNPETGKVWSFSTTLGIEVTSIGTGYLNGLQTTIHGDLDGGVYLHDVGSTFDGTEIRGIYETPYFDLGDSGLRKNYREIVVYTLPEGTANFNVCIRYDFNNTQVHQPACYQVLGLTAPSIYGQATYGFNRYGAAQLPVTTLIVQGSGMTSLLRFDTIGVTDPFTIQGYDINFTASGRI